MKLLLLLQKVSDKVRPRTDGAEPKQNQGRLAVAVAVAVAVTAAAETKK